MEKRLPSPWLPENYPSGCRWGLTSFFNLSAGQKLISNANRMDRHRKEDKCATDRPKALASSDKEYRDGENTPGVVRSVAYGRNTRKGKHKQSSSNGIGNTSNENGKMHNYLREHEKHAKHSGNNSANKVSRSKMTEVFCGISCRNIDCVNTGVIVTKVQSAHATDAAEAVVNRKLINQRSHKSKQVLEALEIVNSNKEVFVKLLENPNSLMARHIQDLRDSQGSEAETEFSSRQQHGFGRSYRTHKKVESPERRRYCYKPSNRIVVLKPQSDFSVRNKLQTVRRSHYPFIRLRRKLRWTQQKKRLLPHIEVEAGSAHQVTCKSTTDLPLTTDSERRSEARRFSNSTRSLLLSECDSQSYPSPESNRQYGFVGDQMRFLPYSSYLVKDDNKLRLLEETKRSLSSGLRLNVDSLSSDCEETSGDRSDCPASSSNSVLITEPQEIGSTPVPTSCDEAMEIEISKEEYPSSPWDIPETRNPIVSDIIEDHVGRLKDDGTECMRFPSGSEMVPDDIRSVNDYVKAVLLAAHLDWDGLLVSSSHVPGQILRASLFDEVKVQCNGSSVDKRILFDYINEVLQEVHYNHQMKKIGTSRVMARIYRDGDLFLQKGSPTLEQLVSKDLAYFRTWIDIPRNKEDIVSELAEDILDDIVSEL